MQRLSDLPSQLFTHIHQEVEAICIINLKFDHIAPKELDASLEYTAARQKMKYFRCKIDMHLRAMEFLELPYKYANL
jgi:hypothetical protein